MRNTIAIGCAAGLAQTALALPVWRIAGRLEIALLLTWCPVLLAVLALVLARSKRHVRAAGYAAMLLMAAPGQAALMGGVGVPILRALAVCGGLAVLIDIVVRAGLSIQGRGVAAVGLAILLAIPGGAARFGGLAADDGVRPTGQKVMVLAGVPLRWGEDAVRAGKDAGVGWRMLAAVFRLSAVDDAGALRTGRWLIVQPRTPTPAGLVAIDAGVRAGARAVILTDPDLRWPSRYALGDPAGPPRTGTLGPLLLHWGLTLEPGDGRTVVRDVRFAGRRWRLLLAGAGRFTQAAGGVCRLSVAGLIADCSIGQGRVILVADADLLDPESWVDDAGGWRPPWRRSDNAAFVAALVAGLARITPPVRPVAWRR